MAIDAGQVLLLRCELDRAADLARAAGMRTPLTRVERAGGVDAELVRAAAAAAGFVLTLWEVSTLQAFDKPEYALFSIVYQNVEAFVGAPTARNLEKAAPSLSLLIAAVSQLRGIADPCNVNVTLPGLFPQAPELSDDSLERLPAPPAPAPRRRARRLGGVVLGGMSAATLALVGAAVVRQLGDDEEPITSW